MWTKKKKKKVQLQFAEARITQDYYHQEENCLQHSSVGNLHWNFTNYRHAGLK